MSDQLRSIGAFEPLVAGQVLLNRYEIVKQLAEGGHSVVYRATDRRLSRPVCVKVFRRRSNNTRVCYMNYQHFVQEAFALSKLSHPNTLSIFDFGHLEPRDGGRTGVPFQVCEFMNAGTLTSQVRRRGPLTVFETRLLMNGLCAALAEAHRHGIIHRDIKPGNILFQHAADWRIAKLADFGIAKFRADEAGGNRLSYSADDTKFVAGTSVRMLSPSWAAPEQLTGERVGPYTDIYAMALIAAYMVSGKVVFPCGDAHEAFRMRMDSDTLVDACLRQTPAPDELIALIKRCCRLDPVARPSTADELAAELRDALQRLPRATPPPVPAHPAKLADDLNMLYVELGMDLAARSAYVRDRLATTAEPPGRLRRAWDRIRCRR